MRRFVPAALIALLALLSACGNATDRNQRAATGTTEAPWLISDDDDTAEERVTIWDAFGPQYNEQKVQVNRYLWTASLDVLDFLPIETIDPFTGVIVTGYGTPPGSNKAYRATIHISDPALDARSLNLAMASRNGPVSRETTRAVEDAILTRARQLRIGDRNL